jgi:type IX secretion system PorP/SprF family membrane protein
MKNMKKQLRNILAAACILPLSAQAQDIHFSQFYETSILRNPSLTGIFTGDYKVGAIYKNQWSSISKPYQTGLINAELRIPVNNVNDFVSVGLLGYYDRAGSINMQTISAYPAVSYSKSLEDGHNSYLSVGFTGGYTQRNYDPTKATLNNQFVNGSYSPDNPTGENFNNPKYSYWDLGAGITFSSTSGDGEEANRLNYVVGVAGYHFTQPNTSFADNSDSRLDMRWNVNAAVSKELNETFSFQIHANYMRQGDYNETIAGGLIGWNKKDASGDVRFVLFGGVFYRFKDAFIPTIKLRYKDVAFNFSYDVNTSRLRAATNLQGGYEISVIKTGIFNDPERKQARVICPVFY